MTENPAERELSIGKLSDEYWRARGELARAQSHARYHARMAKWYESHEDVKKLDLQAKRELGDAEDQLFHCKKRLDERNGELEQEKREAS